MTGRRGRPSAVLLDQVRDTLAGTVAVPGAASFAAALEADPRPLGAGGVLASVGAVSAELVGAGPLQRLLDEPGVTDVLVNGHEQVWVDRGDGLCRVHVSLEGEQELRALAVRLAAATGRRLDEANPYVDARLPDGSRLHAVLPPLSPAGTLLSLRVTSKRTFALRDLVALGSVPLEWVPVLTRVVRGRLSFLVSGGTGSGKTTVLSTLLGLADPADRVLLVEDAAELRPDLPHVVRLEARHGNVEAAGEVTQQELVRQALRMRPDRIVVGECRGEEVRDLLAALNTGHEGGCGTVHANAARDVPARLDALGALAGMDRVAVATQAASALDVVLHLERRAGRRRLVEVGVVARKGEAVAVEPALVWPDATAPPVKAEAWPSLEAKLTAREPFGAQV
ncbi:MAG: TadA family conjugal transfer-associated ATPase [Actinomycetes bacterium]